MEGRKNKQASVSPGNSKEVWTREATTSHTLFWFMACCCSLSYSGLLWSRQVRSGLIRSDPIRPVVCVAQTVPTDKVSSSMGGNRPTMLSSLWHRLPCRPWLLLLLLLLPELCFLASACCSCCRWWLDCWNCSCCCRRRCECIRTTLTCALPRRLLLLLPLLLLLLSLLSLLPLLLLRPKILSPRDFFFRSGTTSLVGDSDDDAVTVT